MVVTEKKYKLFSPIVILVLWMITGYLSANDEVQWASELIGVSSHISSKQYSAYQVLGPPSIMPDFGPSPCAWSPRSPDYVKGEWIHVGFESPVKVRQIAIHENVNPGSITGIYLYDFSNKEYLVYSKPAFKAKGKPGRMLHIIIPETSYRVKSLKLVMDTYKVKNYNQIDAIAISTSKIPVEPEINQINDKLFVSAPENLGSNINSIYSELAPLISQDGKRVYFTRDRHPDNVGKKNLQDVWYSDMNENGNFKEAANIGYPINNSSSNFAVSISPDQNSMLLGTVYKPRVEYEQGLSISYFEGEQWSFPKKIVIDDYYTKQSKTTSSLASDGKTLLMALDRGDGYGQNDIYVSFRKDDGSWAKPLNLGPQINTADDDVAAFLASDGKTIYYSSAGICGFGRNDIFMSRRLDSTWQNWEEPVNIGNVVNTKGWDAYFTIPASGNYAYFVSAVSDDFKEDIYRVRLPKALKPKPVVLITGKVLNSETKKPLPAKIFYEILPGGKEAGIARSNPKTGEYQIVLPGGAKYGFLAEADSFLAVNENLDLTKIDEYSEINRDLMMVPVKVGQKIRLNNIFFDFGKYDLLEDSFAELNRVIVFMKSNNDIKIEIQGHTDDVGSKGFNLNLSQKRAAAVKDYLVKGGIGKSRIKTKGLGQSRPIVPNSNDENRSLNRRVEFLILNK